MKKRVSVFDRHPFSLYVQFRVIRGDYRFTTFRTATAFPSATALMK